MSTEEMNRLKYRSPMLYSIYKIVEKNGPITTDKIAAARYGTGSNRFNKSTLERTAKSISRLRERGAPIKLIGKKGSLGIYGIVD